MINSEKQIFQWAEKYISLGWSLIPVTPNGKEPLIPWKEFQQRKASTIELESWLIKWPNMNLGLVTGQISNVVVVDLDGMVGLTSGRQLQLASAVTSITGMGKQLFYKWTEHVDNSVKKLAPGLDVRGDGGFVVVPPSVHPNGRLYRWEKFVPESLMSLPTGLISVMNADVGSVTTNTNKERLDIAKALEEMKFGNIDDTLFAICSSLRHNGYTEQDARILLEPHANRVGATDTHLEDKIRNVWSRYEPKRMEQNSGVSLYRSESTYDGGSLSIHSPADDDSFNRFEQSQSNDDDVRDRINTGFQTLDRYFEGGLKSERLFTVAARTGTGKTNFAVALAANLCQQGKKVLFFSTEFQYSKIWNRYLATLREPSKFREHAFHVCDSFSPRIEQVEEAIKRIMPDVFIFDHINHISEERESLGAFMQGANYLQRKYMAQGVMVAQLSRQADWVENGKRIEPRMSMIKGSGTIEQASSRVLLLSEVRVTPEMCEIIGVLDKNDSGERGLINFGLYKNPYIFKELI